MDRELFTSSWKMTVVRGVVAVVFGIVAIAWPIETGLALMLLWGFWALLEGISLLVQAVRPSEQGSRWGRALLGVIALIVAFFAVFSPGVTAQALTWIFGIWLIVRGVFEAFTRSAATGSHPAGYSSWGPHCRSSWACSSSPTPAAPRSASRSGSV